MTDEKQETVADIVAEMRDATMNGEFDDETVSEWADRIEAAATRDHVSRRAIKVPIKVLLTGNAAAMREALDLAHETLIGWQLCKTTRAEHAATVAAIKAALAEPARNCDRFFTWTEAWTYWLKHSPKAISCEGGPTGFLDWLFATYVEEGVAK